MNDGTREFLTRSLGDLDREHEAGDLTDADHEQLRDEYERKLAALNHPISAGAPAKARRGLVAASVGFVVVVALAAGFLVAHFAGRRDPGQPLVGGGPQAASASAIPADLARCIELEGGGDGTEIVHCYQGLLDADATDAAALTYFGWFLYREGAGAQNVEVVDTALRLLDRAAAADPTYPDARALRAVVFARLGRIDDARAELDALDQLDADPQLLELIAGLRTQLDEAASTTTTAPSATTVP